MPRPLVHRGARAFVPLAGVFLAVACASAQNAPATRAAPAPATTRPDSSSSTGSSTGAPAWLVADDAGRTVTVALEVTRSPDGTVLLNGHRESELQIVVPLGWTLQWDWRNADSTAAHSLVVMAEREKLPTEGGHPAFSNAMTRMVSAGLAAGQGDRTTFTAEEAGWYWMLCGVPGHAIAGEFLGLRVDPQAKTASVRTK